MIAQSCLLRRPGPYYRHLARQKLAPQWLQHEQAPTAGRRNFHATSRRDEVQDHYATLDLPTNATQAEIKKCDLHAYLQMIPYATDSPVTRKFYSLSKTYHPDLHPDNPDASRRFVAISEAYSTLGSATAREKYDRDFLRQAATSSPSAGPRSHPSGSYSSSANPGGRPASGLSKRRTQFRGPPPSFYRSGGWGEHTEKRSEASSRPSHAHTESVHASTNANAGAAAGTGPGGFTAGFDNDVPHFDQRGHYETHERVAKGRHKTRRKVERVMEDFESGGGGAMGGSWGAFVVICGVLGIALGAPAMMSGGVGGGGKEVGKKTKKEEG